jgi:type I restriction enzyme R subunit
VERYAVPEAWEKLGLEQRTELEREVAGLPSELTDPDLEAKLFDLLILRLQLALLRTDPWFSRYRKSVEEIAGLLEELESIPMVREQMALIQEIQTEDFWQDVTTPILENVRRKLRALVKLIERVKRQPVYTDFADELGLEQETELPWLRQSEVSALQRESPAFPAGACQSSRDPQGAGKRGPHGT